MLHVVSAGGISPATQLSLFMPLLTRMPKHRVKAQVVSLAPGFTAGPVLRQNGVPVHDIAFSRKRFTWGAFGELLRAVREFRPDVLQAWGHTAQLLSLAARSRCDWPLKVVVSPSETAPLLKTAGLIDRQKLKLAAKFSPRVDRFVYTSEASAMLHRRAGFPEDGHAVIAPGVDPMRFKPDFAARKKVREELGLSGEQFVIGMIAPFQPQHDHATLIKAAGELIKTHPNVSLLLAGHGVQKGNGPLMALVGGGTLGTRTHLLGEWSDVSAFFNACDLACSSSLTDSGRLTLVMAMLCGLPCVATGMGAQGEVIGQFGVAVEPGNPGAFIKGIRRVMDMPQDKRAFMVQGARKHALTHFVYVRSMQKYLQLYFDLVGRQALATNDVPTQEIDPSIPAPPPDMQIVIKERKAKATVAMQDLSDPDSLEAKVKESVTYKKLKPDPEPAPEPVVQAPPPREGDVLEIFEEDMSREKVVARNAMLERARGVADESEELLSPEELQVEVAAIAPGAKPAEKPAVVAPQPPQQQPAVASSPVAAPAAPTPEPVAAPATMPSVEFVAEPPQQPAAATSPIVAPAATTPEPVAAPAMPSVEVAAESSQQPAAASSPVAVPAAPTPEPVAAPATMPSVEFTAEPPQQSAVTSSPVVAPAATAPEAVAAPESPQQTATASSSAAPSAATTPEPVAASASMPTVEFAESPELSPQASLFPDVELAPQAQPAASESPQLDLLADPPPAVKRAAG